MKLEIERKFLVQNNDFIEQTFSKKYLKQGYLNSHPSRTVRIRVDGTKGIITIKGKSKDQGTSRLEWEKPILLEEAQQLLLLCEKGVIEKTRHLIQAGKHWYEVDVFEGENKGLVLAEVELNLADEFFEKPSWLGAEVTGNPKYYNSYLSKNPYMQWKQN